MPDIMPKILLTFIICSACFMLLGGIITAIRATKLSSSERILKEKLRACLSTQQLNRKQ